MADDLKDRGGRDRSKEQLIQVAQKASVSAEAVAREVGEQAQTGRPHNA
jgi:hypothetical protein